MFFFFCLIRNYPYFSKVFTTLPSFFYFFPFFAGAFFPAGDFTLFGFGAFFAGAAFFPGVVLVEVLATLAFGLAVTFGFGFGFAAMAFVAFGFGFGLGFVATFFVFGAATTFFVFGFTGAAATGAFLTRAERVGGDSLKEFLTLTSFPEATSFFKWKSKSLRKFVGNCLWWREI